MKANDLIIGKRYRCIWASRMAKFVKFETRTWCGKTENYAIFRDICDCFIECKVKDVERLVK